jgi:serine/threonine protein kinase
MSSATCQLSYGFSALFRDTATAVRQRGPMVSSARAASRVWKPWMTDDPQTDTLEGTILGKKFLVRRLIGSGGMGSVYEVEHVVTKRVGALKLLHATYASVGQVVERFLREASAAGRIGNRHIVETYDAGELSSGEPYIFMELLSGTSVRELLVSRGRLGFEEARDIVLQAGEGLAAAHAAGIVHRDIKPDNLFICDGERAFVKVLDFGISKFTALQSVQRLTGEGAALGTPHYMAPEQVVSKREIDARVDVYALGVVLYECVTGKVPFDAESLPALSVKIFEGKYAPAGEVAGEVPAGLDGLLSMALARDPNQRFASVLELCEALEALDPVPTFATQPVVIETPTSAAVGRTPPEPVTEIVATSAPATPSPKSRARFWIPALLVSAATAAAVIWKATTSEPGLPQRAEIASTQKPAPTPVPSASASASASPIVVAPSASAVSEPSSSPAFKEKVVGKSAPASSRPRSRAAADGLSERNPFAN